MCPLARKRQRVDAEDEPSGPVHVFTKEEIRDYEQHQVRLIN
jgi:hypothetical protein